MEVVAEVVTEVVVASTAVVCPVPPVSIIETVISLLEIRRICSLKGFMSFEDRATVTSTFADPSAIPLRLMVRGKSRDLQDHHQASANPFRWHL